MSFYKDPVRVIIDRIHNLEKRMSQLDTDVQALSAAVTTLTSVVNDAITALGTIVDTSTDDAAVVAASQAIAGLTASLQAATPAPPASPVTETPAS